MQRRQLVVANVQPAQVFGAREGPLTQLPQLVVAELQNKEVDHWGEDALRQVADLVPV